MVTNANMIMHFRGLSTDSDSLPTSGVPNGSEFLEIDTGKIYYYDEESSGWLDPTASDDEPPAGHG